MNSIAGSPGFYGKLPIVGDFISRRLPASFVRPWDAWLQHALASSKDELGPEWLDVYLTSPVWRFALSGGVCGDHACAGILMPSVDNVGRYFPLTLAALLEEQAVLPRLFVTGDRWFTELEALALSALEDDFDLQDFDLRLRNQVLKPTVTHERLQTEARDSENCDAVFRMEAFETERIRDAFIDLSGYLLDRFSPAFSLWCTSGSERVKPSLSVYSGLPPASAFVEFIAGLPLRGETRKNRKSQAMPATKANRIALGAERACEAKSRIPALKWRSNGCSIVGNVRKINEDAYLDRSEIGLWVVADGMGGHQGGQRASKAIVDALSGVSKPGDLEELTGEVSRQLHEVNTDLFEMGQAMGKDVIIGSTVVAMLAESNRCVAMWAGDSRLYRCRNGSLLQLTRDHSLVSELSMRGLGDSEQLSSGGLGSVITRALGAERDIMIDKIDWDAEEDDIFVLCSDGLIRELEDAEIVDILAGADIEQSARALCDAASVRGAGDNVTVIVVSAGRNRS